MTDRGGLLRLRAEDAEDLAILSAAAQDALFRMRDASFDPRARRFTVIMDRFRWEGAAGSGPFERIKAGLSFDSVSSVKSLKVRRDLPDAQAWLLAVEFDADPEPPGGAIRLVLAGGGEIRLQVECIDAAMAEAGDPWRTPRRPDHARDDPGDGEGFGA
jgi:hypothetical protein